MNKIEKTRSVVLYILIVLLFTGCFYDYGVRSDNEQLKYDLERFHFYVDENDTYDFVSPLYHDGISSKPFIIHVEHLSKEPFGKFQSRIIIEDFFPSKDKKIVFKSIKLEHSRRGKILEEDNIFFRANKRSYSKTESKIESFDEEINIVPDEYIIEKCKPPNDIDGDFIYSLEYTKNYNLKFKPNRIDEYIYLEMIIDGELYVLEYNFPLKYKKRNTLGGILNSVMQM